MYNSSDESSSDEYKSREFLEMIKSMPIKNQDLTKAQSREYLPHYLNKRKKKFDDARFGMYTRNINSNSSIHFIGKTIEKNTENDNIDLLHDFLSLQNDSKENIYCFEIFSQDHSIAMLIYNHDNKNEIFTIDSSPSSSPSMNSLVAHIAKKINCNDKIINIVPRLKDSYKDTCRLDTIAAIETLEHQSRKSDFIDYLNNIINTQNMAIDLESIQVLGAYVVRSKNKVFAKDNNEDSQTIEAYEEILQKMKRVLEDRYTYFNEKYKDKNTSEKELSDIHREIIKMEKQIKKNEILLNNAKKSNEKARMLSSDNTVIDNESYNKLKGRGRVTETQNVSKSPNTRSY